MTNSSRTSLPLQRSKKDLIATATIAIAALVGVGTVWVTAPVSHSTLYPAEKPYESAGVLSTMPEKLTQSWAAENRAVPALRRPLSVEGLSIIANGGTVSALNPVDGSIVWSYERELEVCSLSTAFGSVVATYRNPAGCGDVTQIDAKTGQYRSTRSAPNSDTVVPISSNDRVGVVSPERLEIWRSDLVRTVEYGDKDAKQEPNLQPHEECTISSALTRKDVLAVVEECEDQADNSMLRFQETTPEDSRKPKIKEDVALPGTDAQLVGIGQTEAVVYVPSNPPRLISYDENGKEESRLDVAESPLINEHLKSESGQAFAPETADLPHHMTWFDGQRLYLLNPASLATEVIFEGALGTGVAVGDRIVFPVKNGIAVGRWDEGTIERTIPVDRGSYDGPVSIAMTGTTIVEKRGPDIVGLRG